MRRFEELGKRGQIGRLRRLGEHALVAYGVAPARLVLLAHQENTTFRVDTTDGQRHLLRIHRVIGSEFHPPKSTAEVRSELLWLTALRRDADLAVPEPISTTDGELLTVVEVDGVPGPRICVLLGWGPGRFLYRSLTPAHLEQVGAFMARLHDQAVGFVPPPGFERNRIGVGAVAGDVGAHLADFVADVMGSDAGATVAAAMAAVRRTQDALGERRDVFGMIHADVHQENYLFDGGDVRAIDFDDCGWGHFAYDLCVPLSELRHRSDYADLRAGLLRGYRSVRPFPTEHEHHIEVFHALRLVMLVHWFLEQRHHPSFADWEDDVTDELDGLTAHMERRIGT